MGEIWTQRQIGIQEEYQMKMTAEIGVMYLQAKEHQKSPVNH